MMKNRTALAQPQEAEGMIPAISNIAGTTTRRQSPVQQVVSHPLHSLLSSSDLSFLASTTIIWIIIPINTDTIRTTPMAPHGIIPFRIGSGGSAINHVTKAQNHEFRAVSCVFSSPE